MQESLMASLEGLQSDDDNLHKQVDKAEDMKN